MNSQLKCNKQEESCDRCLASSSQCVYLAPKPKNGIKKRPYRDRKSSFNESFLDQHEQDSGFSSPLPAATSSREASGDQIASDVMSLDSCFLDGTEEGADVFWNFISSDSFSPLDSSPVEALNKLSNQLLSEFPFDPMLSTTRDSVSLPQWDSESPDAINEAITFDSKLS